MYSCVPKENQEEVYHDLCCLLETTDRNQFTDMLAGFDKKWRSHLSEFVAYFQDEYSPPDRFSKALYSTMLTLILWK